MCESFGKLADLGKLYYYDSGMGPSHPTFSANGRLVGLSELRRGENGGGRGEDMAKLSSRSSATASSA